MTQVYTKPIKSLLYAILYLTPLANFPEAAKEIEAAIDIKDQTSFIGKACALIPSSSPAHASIIADATATCQSLGQENFFALALAGSAELHKVLTSSRTFQKIAATRTDPEVAQLSQILELSAQQAHSWCLVTQNPMVPNSAISQLIRSSKGLEENYHSLNESSRAHRDALNRLQSRVEENRLRTPIKTLTPGTSWGTPVETAPAFLQRAAQNKVADFLNDPNGPKVMVITGGLGVGKSQIAAAAFRDGKAEAKRCLTAWFKANSPAGLVEAYAEAAGSLGIVEPNSTDLKHSQHLLFEALERRQGWLIVLDDLSSGAEAIDSLLPPATGKTLITTRRHGVLEALRARIPDLVLEEIDVFKPRESSNYLRTRLAGSRHLPRGRLPSAAADLAKDLGHLPVTLNAACHLLLPPGDDSNSFLTIKELRNRLREPGAKIGELLVPAGEQPSIARLWEVALKDLERKDACFAARWAYLVSSFLDAGQMPRAVWLTESVRMAVAELSGCARPISRSEMEHVILPALVERAFFDEPESGGRTLTLHSLAQRCAREALPPAARHKLLRAVADGLLTLWSEPTLDWHLDVLIRRNAARIANEGSEGSEAKIPRELVDDSCHPLLVRLVHELIEAGFLDDAAELLNGLEKAAAAPLDHLLVEAARAELVAEKGDLESAITHLASVLQDLDGRAKIDMPTDVALDLRYRHARWLSKRGRPEEALVNLSSLLPEVETCFGRDSSAAYKARYQLGRALGLTGKVKEAVETLTDLQREQRISRCILERHLLKTSAELARWIGHQGDARQAVVMLYELYDSYVRLYGAHGRATLGLRRRIAYWQGKSGDAKGAYFATRKLLLDCEALLPRWHKDSLQTARNAAFWEAKAGKPRRAVKHLAANERACAKHLGEDHLWTLTAARTRAVMVGEAGDPKGAVTRLRASQERLEGALGIDSPESLANERYLADWLGNSGDPSGAVEAHYRLLSRLEAVTHDPVDPRVLTVRKNLAKWLLHSGRPLAAASYMKTLVPLIISAHGYRHPQTYSLWGYQHETLGVLGDRPRASSLFSRLAETMSEDSEIGWGDREALLATNAHLYWLSKCGVQPAQEAAVGFELLVAEMRAHLGPRAPETFICQANRAFALGLANRIEDSLELFEQLSQKADLCFAPTHPEVFVFRSNWARWMSTRHPEPAHLMLTDLLAGTSAPEGAGWVAQSHPQHITARIRLAHVQRALGLKEACQTLKEAVADLEALEAGHPRRQQMADLLGAWRSQPRITGACG